MADHETITDSAQSQRDLAVRVPINFVPVAGVAVNAACFIGDTYDAAVLAKCISNLLVLEYRRFSVDIYWDESRSVWSFCPVQLGSAGQVATTSTTVISTRTSPTQIASATLNVREPETPSGILEARQNVTNTNASTTALVRVGPYACSATANLDLFLGVLATYLAATENSLNATTTYLSLNLHAAAASDLIVRPPNNLPDGPLSLRSLLSVNNTDYLYTPDDLRQQRTNLNTTGNWFAVPENIIPDAAYFRVTQQGSTPDGWPSDSYVEFSRAQRLLVSFGFISKEMSQYDVASDLGTIFSPGDLRQSRPTQLSASGQVTSGCFFNADTIQISNVNNSWAVAEVQTTDAQAAARASTSLTNCGYTPVLNQTLDNISAASSPTTYLQFVMGSIWSWDDNEPQDSRNSSSLMHCAVLNATSGRWQVDSCSTSRYCACRIDNGPYNWQISTSKLPYDRVDQACESGSVFTVARTALENRYLLNTWRMVRTANSISDELLFLNFNDLDVPTCWVVGQNTTCPYQVSDNSSDRVIVVPTVAAVIVFVLTILTIFVKCAANRQNTKRRRRRGNDDSGDYEGVPA